MQGNATTATCLVCKLWIKYRITRRYARTQINSDSSGRMSPLLDKVLYTDIFFLLLCVCVWCNETRYHTRPSRILPRRRPLCSLASIKTLPVDCLVTLVTSTSTYILPGGRGKTKPTSRSPDTICPLNLVPKWRKCEMTCETRFFFTTSTSRAPSVVQASPVHSDTDGTL